MPYPVIFRSVGITGSVICACCSWKHNFYLESCVPLTEWSQDGRCLYRAVVTCLQCCKFVCILDVSAARLCTGSALKVSECTSEVWTRCEVAAIYYRIFFPVVLRLQILFSHCVGRQRSLQYTVRETRAKKTENEINVPLAFSAFRDKGSWLWSCKKKREKREKERKKKKNRDTSQWCSVFLYSPTEVTRHSSNFNDSKSVWVT